MKKRLLAVLLAACTVFSLAACGSSNNSDDSASGEGSGDGAVQTVTDG